MKRLCTKQEREVLYKNRKQMIKGKYGTAANGRLSDIFVSFFLATIVTIGMLYALVVTDKIDFVMQDNEFGFELIFILPLLFMCFVVEKTRTQIMRKREERSFKKREDVMINGATIVEVDMSGCFSYIEDDFYDENGRTIILVYPSKKGEVKPEDVGKRMLVLYAGDFGFRLVKLNDELRGLLPNVSSDYPLKEDMNSYMSVPHPNMVNLEKAEHNLSESEKKYFADLYVKATRSVYFKRLKVCSFVLPVCFAIMSVGLGMGKDAYPVSKCIMFGVAGCACTAVLIYLLNLLNRTIIKRRAKFVSMKKVVFMDYGTRNKVSIVRGFEWKQNQVQLCEYPGCEIPAKTPYGSILYKLVNPKGKIFLVNANPVK